MRRAVVRLAAAGLAISALLSACEFDFDDIPSSGKPLTESNDPEVRKAAEAEAKAQKIYDANRARDRFLKTGDLDDLKLARSLNPDDPELAALGLADAGTTENIGRALISKLDLLNAITKQRKARGEPVDDKSLRMAASQSMLDANARLLAGKVTGGIDPEPEDRYHAQLLANYCDLMKSYKKNFKDDGWLLAHQGDFGFPCK